MTIYDTFSTLPHTFVSEINLLEKLLQITTTTPQIRVTVLQKKKKKCYDVHFSEKCGFTSEAAVCVAVELCSVWFSTLSTPFKPMRVG